MTTPRPFPTDVFSDVLAANGQYVGAFQDSGLTGFARQGLAIVTCMDSRIDPLAIVGMKPGDVKILRNAGARVTEDVLRTLVLATHLLGVERVLVMPHTDCRMAKGDESDIHRLIAERSGVDTTSIHFATVSNQQDQLVSDVAAIRGFELLPASLGVGGAIYDVHSGKLSTVSC
ncbi:MAG: beta-class carbonic anhydrase [Ilumatobacteraceae bacterium]